jgi:DNA topoisomerase-1
MPKQDMDERIGRKCPTCEQGDLVIKFGRWGKFIGCSEFPECRHTEPHLEKTGFSCPECGDEQGGELVKRRSRKGKRRLFYGCSRYPDCEYATWNLPKPEPHAPAQSPDYAVADRTAG